MAPPLPKRTTVAATNSGAEQTHRYLRWAVRDARAAAGVVAGESPAGPRELQDDGPIPEAATVLLRRYALCRCTLFVAASALIPPRRTGRSVR